jgi:thiamine biosynthesis lipoprotein
MGLEKAKKFLEKHKELQAYLIYSDDKGNYQIYETPGVKSIVSEVE